MHGARHKDDIDLRCGITPPMTVKIIMKKAIIAATLTMVVTAAQAESDTMEQCQLLSGVAGSVMENRQIGVPMSSTMDVMVSGKEDEVKAFLSQIVTLAYGIDKQHTAELQQAAITKFTEVYFIKCMKDLSK